MSFITGFGAEPQLEESGMMRKKRNGGLLFFLVGILVFSTSCSGRIPLRSLELRTGDTFHVRYIIEETTKQRDRRGEMEFTLRRELEFTLETEVCYESGANVFSLKYQGYTITIDNGEEIATYQHRNDDPIMEAIGNILEHPIRITLDRRGRVVGLEDRSLDLEYMIGGASDHMQRQELTRYYNYFFNRQFLQEMFLQFYSAYPRSIEDTLYPTSIEDMLYPTSTEDMPYPISDEQEEDIYLRTDQQWISEWMELEPANVLYEVENTVTHVSGNQYTVEKQGEITGDFPAHNGFTYRLDIQMLGEAVVTPAKGLQQNTVVSVVTNGSAFVFGDGDFADIAFVNRKSISFEILKR